MSNPLPVGGMRLVLAALMVIVIGTATRIVLTQPAYYAHAYSDAGLVRMKTKSPIFESGPSSLFVKNDRRVEKSKIEKIILKSDDIESSGNLSAKIYAIVGESPIKEMVPFIAQKDSRVAAFLIGIAKKESSFGQASPSKDGKDCYNYWGYKGMGGRGTGMGYACFSSPEEAVEVVGGRIEELVNKERNTPIRMVDTWKCGTSCKGDAGAPGWVSTVTLYFDKIVDRVV